LNTCHPLLILYHPPSSASDIQSVEQPLSIAENIFNPKKSLWEVFFYR
jgi:hypothetical protein